MTEPLSDEDLRAAYKPILRESNGGHRSDCPTPDALLAAVRGEGAEPDRLLVLDRALRCAACRRDLALLEALSGKAPARASLARPAAWRRWVPLAAAAMVLIAVGLVGIDRWRRGGGDDITRSGGSGDLDLLMPDAGESVASGRVSFVWRPVSGALGYTLEVYATDGTVLFVGETADTVFAPPPSALVPGERRWAVRARLDDGTELRSETRALRLR